MDGDSSRRDNQENILHDQSSKPRNLPLQLLKEITDSFSNERILGNGGFGVVYKGVQQNGEMIAVKKLMPLAPGCQKKFENEVHHLMRLKHPNIVQFVGYCYEIKHEYLKHDGKYIWAEMVERLLCLEYMPKGSLDVYISDESSGLDWHTRFKIIKGVCYGLNYLHELTEPIIHLDLKPANILLGENLVPKLTDFGLSRLLDQERTIYTSTFHGTLGYMAPEYLHRGRISRKSDIFSLGVIIMEVITGHKDYPDVTTTSSENFTELELKKWRQTLEKAPGYTELETDCQQIKRCIEIGLICVEADWTKRPTTTEIINMLHGHGSESMDCQVSNEVTSPADQVLQSHSGTCNGHSDDIEDEANMYFHRMFPGQISIDAMIQMMARFKESKDKRDLSIFNCIISNLFEEYKFFPRYPLKQLKLAAMLVGSVIKHRLVSHLGLEIALRSVLDALRKSPDSKMFIFGTTALKVFVDRVGEWPQYRDHLQRIPHLRGIHPELVSAIEQELQTAREMH